MARLRLSVGIVLCAFTAACSGAVPRTVPVPVVETPAVVAPAAGPAVAPEPEAVTPPPVEEAEPAEFFARPRSDRAKDFLSKILTH